MLDPTSQVTVGGALLVVIWMLLKYKPWRNSHNNRAATKGGEKEAGELSPADWEGRMRMMHVESAESIITTIRTILASRNEEIRRIVREEIRNAKAKE